MQGVKVENTKNLIASTDDHNMLINKDLPNQHPISAITGLQDELDSLNEFVNAPIDGNRIVNNTITSEKIADGAIASIKLGNASVNNSKITNGSITTEKIRIGNVTEDRLSNEVQEKLNKSGVYVGTGDMPEGYNVQIDPSGTTEDYATKQYVDSAIGDIDTVLDNIIAIQNSLMGGGSV